MDESPKTLSLRIGWRRFIMGCIIVATVIFLLLFASNQFPSMRGPDEWQWPYAISSQPFRQLLPIVILLAYGLIVYSWGKRLIKDEAQSRKAIFTFLVFIWLAGAIIQFALLWPDRYGIVRPLFFRTISAGASGVFTVGSRIESAADYLTNYPELMPYFPVHPQRYPPGLPLISHVAQLFFEQFPWLSEPLGFYLRLYQCRNLEMMNLSNAAISAAVVQMALPLISSLLVFPLYGLANRVAGKQTAVWSVALYPLVPPFVLWAAVWDQFYPLLAVTAWYLFYVGLTEQRRWPIFLAGFTVSVASFLTFGILALLAPMGLWALFWLWAHRPQKWGQILLDGLIFVLGAISIWIMLRLFFGTSILEIWQVSMGFHLGLGLDYSRWIWIHLYDFGMFLSIPLLILLIIGLVLAVRDLWHGDWNPFILAFGLGLLLLDVSGMSQGEVSRVWLFLTPFAVITAVWATLRLFPRTSAFAVILGLMIMQLLIFNAFLRIITTGVEDPIPREIVYIAPMIANPMDVQFDDEIQLLGYDLTTSSVDSNHLVNLTLYWQTAQQMTQPYTVFVHMVSEDGQIVAQQDNMPQKNNLPTTCWLPGEIVVDTYDLAVDSETTVEEYDLAVGLYWLNTGERLPVFNQGKPVGDALLLSTIHVSD